MMTQREAAAIDQKLAVIDRRLALVQRALTLFLNEWMDEHPCDEAPPTDSPSRPAPKISPLAALRRDPKRVVLPFQKPGGAA